MNILGERVKELRLKQGLTQQELADMLSTSNMNIANIESGRVKNPRNLSELAEKDFYVVSIDKDEKLFLTDNAKIVAKVKKTFSESK